MKIDIIGCGWLGFPLAKRLSAEHEVYGTVRCQDNLERLKSIGVRGFLYDLNQEDNIDSELTENVDVLIIAVPPFGDRNSNDYAIAMQRLSAQFDSNVKVIFCSSTGIYPKHSGTYDEHFEFLEGEKENYLYRAEQVMIKQFGSPTILRLAGLFGPGRHPANSLQGKLDVTNPFGLVNLVHLEDVIRIIIEIIEKNKFGEIYNVVNPEHPFRKEYYNKIYRQHNLQQIGFVISPTSERKISSRKVMSDLDFKFEKSVYHVDECFNN